VQQRLVYTIYYTNGANMNQDQFEKLIEEAVKTKKEIKIEEDIILRKQIDLGRLSGLKISGASNIFGAPANNTRCTPTIICETKSDRLFITRGMGVYISGLHFEVKSDNLKSIFYQVWQRGIATGKMTLENISLEGNNTDTYLLECGADEKDGNCDLNYISRYFIRNAGGLLKTNSNNSVSNSVNHGVCNGCASDFYFLRGGNVNIHNHNSVNTKILSTFGWQGSQNNYFKFDVTVDNKIGPDYVLFKNVDNSPGAALFINLQGSLNGKAAGRYNDLIKLANINSRVITDGLKGLMVGVNKI
jgi:hypothetical protein